MKNLFEALEKSVLVDKLADYTLKYTRLITEIGFQPDVDNCKMMIEELQAEIEKRKFTLQW